jgi:hypothetical protein
MNILVLQPIRPNHPPALRERASALLAALPAANPGMRFDIRQDDTALAIPEHPSLYKKHAMVRNYMLDTYLRDEHDAVLWVDSDLVEYDAALPSLLHAANPGGITAPLALLSPTSGWADRFYDIGGFIEDGRRAQMWRPWFEQQGDVIELDSVGCCYLAPAELYRAGARYAPPPTDYYVEHWSVMRQAKQRGYRICALTTARAIHAWLPDYGLEAN